MRKHAVITVSREYGSGGRFIAKQAAEALGIAYYDREIIELSAMESGLSKDYVAHNEQKITNSFLFNLATVNGYYPGAMSFRENLRPEDTLFLAQVRVIRELAEQGPCVIVGRCADYILREREDVLNVFIYADMEKKVERASQFYHLSAQTAQSELRKQDRMRSNHYSYYTGQVWGERKNYHVCINSGLLGIDRSVKAICALSKLD